ncbi:hypothetical protein GmHk_16G046602 [Glycine max]|nr:hypothetical protein GmHk_16G046602 [Glycine max]
MNQNAGRPYGGNKRVNDGPNRMEGQNRINGVKLNVPPFKGRSDPNAYLDWEMKIQHVFSCNDYTEEQKVKGHIASECLTKRTMIMKADGKITSESEISEEEDMKKELEEEAMQGDMLMWLSEDEEVKVTQQVEVCLTIGRYHARVLCDMVPMEVTHILLRRP